MGISNWQLYGLFILVLSTITSQSLISIQSDSIHSEPPHLSRSYRDNRSPFHVSENINTNQNEVEVITQSNEVFPCNGSYLKTNGTTCGLKEIMIGRCYESQYITRDLYFSNTTVIKNCSKLYELFETAVLNNSYCSMNISTYENYFSYALNGVGAINRAMFWSGTNVIAHTYSAAGSSYITLEDTLAGGMANGLIWCGKENGTEDFDYVSCPYDCNLAFWNLASQTFAQKAAGEIYVVLNGTRTGQSAFQNTSTFASIELPNLQINGPNRVTNINILVLHKPDQNVIERCGNNSILVLENLIQQKQLNYTCIDDPEQVILIMCEQAPTARECQIAEQALEKQWNTTLYGISVADHHSISFLLLPFLLISSQLFRSNLMKF